jgi:hypothetical protein
VVDASPCSTTVETNIDAPTIYHLERAAPAF